MKAKWLLSAIFVFIACSRLSIQVAKGNTADGYCNREDCGDAENPGIFVCLFYKDIFYFFQMSHLDRAECKLQDVI